jgi:hypothetical protein
VCGLRPNQRKPVCPTLRRYNRASRVHHDWSCTVEVSEVRKRVTASIERARTQAQERRQRNADAEKAYGTFLENVAGPLAKQVVNVLKGVGPGFTVFTPNGGLRLDADKGRDDHIEFALDLEDDTPQVVIRARYTRGSRTLEDVQPIKPHTGPADLTDADVLDALLVALEPWLTR